MKLEVGMYVRHKPLLSSKYVKINKIKEIEEKENCLYIWLEDKDLITEKYLIKVSYNIIDILEVGDYVNGSEILDFENRYIEEDDKFVPIGVITENCYLENTDSWIIEKNIKSVITHEQMEQMEYRIGE